MANAWQRDKLSSAWRGFDDHETLLFALLSLLGYVTAYWIVDAIPRCLPGFHVQDKEEPQRSANAIRDAVQH